jgi:hypothetical protein
VNALAKVLIQKFIGFTMIAQLRGLLLFQFLPQPSLPSLQQPNIQQAFILLEKQPLLLST